MEIPPQLELGSLSSRAKYGASDGVSRGVSVIVDTRTTDTHGPGYRWQASNRAFRRVAERVSRQTGRRRYPRQPDKSSSPLTRRAADATAEIIGHRCVS
jgi:hypothetical protein